MFSVTRAGSARHSTPRREERIHQARRHLASVPALRTSAAVVWAWPGPELATPAREPLGRRAAVAAGRLGALARLVVKISPTSIDPAVKATACGEGAAIQTR